MADEFELETLSGMSNYYDWILETFEPFVYGSVIEYGAGTGVVSERLYPLSDRLVLVEPVAKFVQALQDRFRNNLNVAIVCGSIEQHALGAAAGTFDTAVIVNVLEHIENDREALTALFHVLKPGGHLLVFVPAVKGLMSKLDRLFGHFRRYRRGELLEKIADAGGETQVCRYFDLIGVLPWFVLNRVMGATTFDPRLIRFHDRFVVPISRAIERHVTLPIGKNIILVARKK